MTTLPPEPSGSAASEPAAGPAHRQRDVAEGFGADAARYDRARPTYPDGLIDRILATSPGPSVLDVGCGTGIVARLLQAKGATVLGVEPDPRMAGVARDSGTEVEVAKIEDWDPAGRRFDAVVAGQAWHWVDPVAGAAVAATALAPGGRLTLFWNSSEVPPEIGKSFGEVFASVETGLPYNAFAGPPGVLTDLYRKGCDRAADGMREAGGFGEPDRWEFEWSRPYTRAEYLDVIPTLGGMNRVPADKLSALLSGFGKVIDEAGGAFTASYTTVAISAPRARAAITASQ